MTADKTNASSTIRRGLRKKMAAPITHDNTIAANTIAALPHSSILKVKTTVMANHRTALTQYPRAIKKGKTRMLPDTQKDRATQHATTLATHHSQKKAKKPIPSAAAGMPNVNEPIIPLATVRRSGSHK